MILKTKELQVKMFEQLLYILPPILGLFYYLGGVNIAKEVIAPIYKRWKNLNRLVSTTESSTWFIILISLKLVIYSLYISFLQNINKTVRKIDKKTYEISYVINGKLYKMISHVQFGPSPILQIIDDQENDVTETVLPYMGPSYNWHGNKISPDFFGHNSLTFELADGTEYTYGPTEPTEPTADNNREFNEELLAIEELQKDLQISMTDLKLNLLNK